MSDVQPRKYVGRRVTSGWKGVFLRKSLDLKQRRVYSAMLSRGFSGEALLLDDFTMRSRDWWALATLIHLRRTGRMDRAVTEAGVLFELSNVCFAFVGDALRNLCLAVQPGEQLAGSSRSKQQRQIHPPADARRPPLPSTRGR